jgi:hypothetical protein
MNHQLMLHCMMMHVGMISLSLKGGTTLPMQDLVHVTLMR